MIFSNRCVKLCPVDIHIMEYLVASAVNDEGQTPLILATMEEDENMVKSVLQGGVNVNTMTIFGQTALEEATLNGCTKIVIMLIEAGADVNFLAKSRHTALMLAMHKGNLRMGEVLIKAFADVDKFCSGGRTALSHCAFKGNEDGVRMLVEAGADVNKVDEDGDTSLMMAVWNGHRNITEALIESGADVNKVGKGCDTALMIAVRKGHVNITEALIEAGVDMNRPFLQDEQDIHSVLVEGTDLSIVGEFGDTIQKAYVNIIEILIESGADVNKICEKNKVALLLAFKSNKKGVRLLLRSGARVNIGRQSFSTLKPDIRLILYAAGEMMMNYPEYLKSSTNTLHHHCRMAIRRHLLKLDRHENLFLRIPCFGLPSRLTKYLLFDTSQDENDT